MRKQNISSVIIIFFFLYFAFYSNICAATGFHWCAVISEHIDFNQTDWPDLHPEWRMLAATRVRPSPDYNPRSQPVYVSSDPTGEKKLYFGYPLEEFSPDLFAHIFVSAFYDIEPVSDWEEQTYTFYSNANETPSCSVTINEGEINQISYPGSVSYDPTTRIVTWDGIDSRADTVFVRVVPLKPNGKPDTIRMAWESGHLDADLGSYTLPDWGPPGEYALKFESRQYRQSDQQILNRSVWYQKIKNLALWCDPVIIKTPCTHIKALSLAVDPNQRWHAVYRDTGGSYERIMYINSNDFMNPVPLITASNTDNSLRYPSIAIDGNGTLHVLYVLEKESEDWLMYVKYDSSGWSNPIRIAIPLSNIKALSVTAGLDGIWHAIYREVFEDGERINHICSTNFTPLALVITNYSGESLRYPSIAIDEKGTIHVMYDHQYATGEHHLMYMKKYNEIWTDPNEIAIPSTDIKALSLCADAYGTWHAIYRSSQEDTESLLYINSTNFTEPIRLLQSENSLRYPSINVFDKGQLHALYVSERNPGQYLTYVHTVSTPEEICPFFKSAWPQAAWFRGIWGSSSSDIYVVGSPHCNWGTNKGCVLLHYDGTMWQRIHSPTYNSLNDIWGTSASNIFAVGAGGTIIHFDGNSWSKMNTGTDQDLYAIWGSSASDVFAVGQNGTILHYDGNNWAQMDTSNIDTPRDLHAVWGFSSNDVYAGGYNKFLHYNGQNWEEILNPSSYTITAIWGISSTNLYFLDTFAGVYEYVPGWGSYTIVDPSPFSNYGGSLWGTSTTNLFIVGNQHKIEAFTGNSWQTFANPSLSWLSDIWGISQSNAYAVGYRGTILHFDGSSWNQIGSVYFTPDPDEDDCIDGLDLAYFARAYGKEEVSTKELGEFAEVFGKINY